MLNLSDRIVGGHWRWGNTRFCYVMGRLLWLGCDQVTAVVVTVFGGGHNKTGMPRWAEMSHINSTVTMMVVGD